MGWNYQKFPNRHASFWGPPLAWGLNYHVELREDRHYYSVPCHLRRRDPPTRVKLVYDERIVAIYWDNVRVAQHRRDRTPNGYTTLPEHMPPQHRWYAEWSPERFLSWARAIGPETAELIATVLSAAAYPPQAYRSCLGIFPLCQGSCRPGELGGSLPRGYPLGKIAGRRSFGDAVLL